MEDLYYTAGLIDGEGTVTLAYARGNSKFRSPIVSCSSTTYAIVDYLQKTYGGLICIQKVRKPHHKQSWSWSIRNDRAINFCAVIFDKLLEPDKSYRAKMIAFEYKKVTNRNGKYSEDQKANKLQFQEEFFHPSVPAT